MIHIKQLAIKWKGHESFHCKIGLNEVTKMSLIFHLKPKPPFSYPLRMTWDICGLHRRGWIPFCCSQNLNGKPPRPHCLWHLSWRGTWWSHNTADPLDCPTGRTQQCSHTWRNWQATSQEHYICPLRIFSSQGNPDVTSVPKKILVCYRRT